MKNIKLGKGNKVDDLFSGDEFSAIVQHFIPREVYDVNGLNEKELLNSFDKFSKLTIETYENNVMEFDYAEFVNFRSEAKELFVFRNETHELNVFYSANSDEVFGELHESENENSPFLKTLNEKWKEFITENKLKILIDSGDENLEDLIENIKFVGASFSRSIDGYFSESYVIDRYDVKVKIKDKIGKFSALPEFNNYGDSFWYLDAYIEYMDTPDGKLNLKSGVEIHEYFLLEKTQAAFILELFSEFEMSELCEEEYELRKSMWLKNEIEKYQGLCLPSIKVEANFSHRGIELEYKSENEDVVNKSTIFHDYLIF